MSSAISFNLDQPKCLSSGNGLINTISKYRTTARLLPGRSIKSSSISNFTVALLLHCFMQLGGLGVYNSYLLQIWALEDHLDVFLLYAERTVLYR